MLELLTGKSPSVMALDGVDLPRWVAMIAKERGTFEVFDRELRETRADDLLYALNVGLHCVDPSPRQRPEVVQVLHQLSEIRAYLGIEKKSHVDSLALRGTGLSNEKTHVDFEK
uniref:Probably inactive leucine-rich repeat receptor-like protein kinase IMK2 n=1 Tax=Anthurium amnicola TaxID=1678845 RepID=A0A1D1Z2Y4_9ARAE